MSKKRVIDIRIPKDEIKILERVAEIAELTVSQVCNVLIAFGIVRAQESGILKKKRRGKDKK